MKMNNREKILLCVLGILVVGGGYYSLVYTPLSEKVAAAENTKSETENKYNTVMSTIKNIENKKSDLKILKSQIMDCSQGFYPAISEEHIIVELNQLLTSSGLNGGIKFDPVVSQAVEKSDKENVSIPESSVQRFVEQYSQLNPDAGIKNTTKEFTQKNKQNDNSNNASTSSNIENSSNNSNSTDNTDNNSNNTSSNNANPENKNENKVQYLKCSVTFKGTYEDLNTFLKSIRESKRKIIVNSLSTSQDSTNGVSGTIKLEIYSIPKIDNELESYLKWDSNGTYNSTAAFSAEPVNDMEGAEGEKVDFVLSAKPMSSDLPTLIMGKAKDSSRTTYVYADSNKQEDVEFILNQDGNKYYYKYKTSKGTYPKDFNGKGVEFIPSLTTSISINAFSESRLNSDDEAGVKLKVTNNTDMLLNVNISGDDSTNPRITVDGDSSGISINQK